MVFKMDRASDSHIFAAPKIERELRKVTSSVEVLCGGRSFCQGSKRKSGVSPVRACLKRLFPQEEEENG